MRPRSVAGRRGFLVGVLVAAACAALAACGSSSSKDIGEITSCLKQKNLPVGNASSIGAAHQVQVQLPDGTAAPVEVDPSDAEAQKQAKDWKAFGAAGGKTGTIVVQGSTWVGYPGPVPASFKSSVEDCAF